MENVKLSPIAKMGIGGAVAFVAGVGIGYYLAARRTPTIIAAEPTDTNTAVQYEGGAVVMTQEEYDSHTRLLEQYRASAEEVEFDHNPAVSLGEIVVETNVFAVGDDWDIDTEMEHRSVDAPYILHRDEFYSEEKGYSHTTLTYYVGDNTLTDEQDVPIQNYGPITGELRFGHGSGDSRTVFIRNDKYHAEYEILLNDGSFRQEILGLQAEQQLTPGEIKHSQRRLRTDD